jgi:hypothetical protein
MLEAFIREFPDSQYVRLARIELAGLPTEPTPALLPSSKVDTAAVLAQAWKLYNAKDYAGSMPLFRQAADAGNGEAMRSIGFMYEKGLGVGQDYGKLRAGIAGAPMPEMARREQYRLAVPERFWREAGLQRGHALVSQRS